MNKKQMIIAAMATVLSISAASATDITGITGVGGVYDINPEKINGDVGYRQYTNFNLDAADKANLIFYGLKNGEERNLGTFINLVQNEAVINGVLNSVDKNGNFANGHTVFMTPAGFTVGPNGVLNVGTLSVITPKATKFESLKNDYNVDKFDVINNISQLRNSTYKVDNNHGGNAPVNIQGNILARTGVDLRGSQVDIAGKIVNGYNGTDVLASKAAADVLFESLVNTNGIVAGRSLINNDAGNIVIKSGVGAGNRINVSGTIANLGGVGTETAITNHGTDGLTVSGKIYTNDKLNLYNNNMGNHSALTVTDAAKINGYGVSLTNKGKGGLNIAAPAKADDTNVYSGAELEVVNKGGKAVVAGNLQSVQRMDIVNKSEGGMEISGDVYSIPAVDGTMRVVNHGGQLDITGSVKGTTVSVRNTLTGEGTSISGTVAATNGALIENRAGDLDIAGKVEVTNGDLAIVNKNPLGTNPGQLKTGADSELLVKQGRMIIRNKAAGGMNLAGTITNQNGETAINNDNGALVIGGTITNKGDGTDVTLADGSTYTKGNMGISHHDDKMGMVVNGTVNNDHIVKVINYNGTGVTVNGTVNNEDGRLYVYNGNGNLTVNGNLLNKKGDLLVTSRKNSNGVFTSAGSRIENADGTLAIVNKGKIGNNSGTGMNLKGIVRNNNGITGINNYSGDMKVAGTIYTENGDLGIINRGTDKNIGSGRNAEIAANITSTGNKTVNIKNNGTGNMTVAGEITHDGRLNVLANEGKLILDGKVHNVGNDQSYMAARKHGTGIEVTKNFSGDTKNQLMMIKNISGNTGLQYAGTMKATKGGQVEVYNLNGDMTVTSDAKLLDGNQSIILNKGAGMTVQEGEFTGDLKIVNKGTKKATVADKYNKPGIFYEQLSK